MAENKLLKGGGRPMAWEDDTVSIFCTARCSQCGRLGPAILLKESCGGYGDVAAFYCATGDDAQAVYDRLGCAARQKKETP